MESTCPAAFWPEKSITEGQICFGHDPVHAAALNQVSVANGVLTCAQVEFQNKAVSANVLTKVTMHARRC